MTSDEILKELARMIWLRTDLFPEDAEKLAGDILDLLEEKELLR